ncbi:hypothetical protein GH714_041408 [Hevea brasiliensis]|uniref:Actin-related protein n=1 Tax=Hevea brasiliensis TaxID=3981 RepID=A0A6A6N1Q8_HEVBR|nr:hypothetical protein GH714_041408 [Hevea brasiliensis]
MSNVIVLDNGGGFIKAGHGGERDPVTVIPNCLYRPLSSKKFLHPSPTASASTEDLTSAAVRRPIDRGYLINPDLQRDIWSHLFTSLLHITPSNYSLLLTEPPFTLPSIQRATDELVFEDFGFKSLFITDSPKLVHLYEASRRPDGKRGKDNVLRCVYVLPDGITHTKGFVKDPDEAKRYLTMTGADSPSLETIKGIDRPELSEKLEERRRIDLTKNEFELTNERFLVPEMIFHPADLVVTVNWCGKGNRGRREGK